MNQLSLCFLGNIIGALLGPLVNQSAGIFEFGKNAAFILFVLGGVWTRGRIWLWPLAMMTWIFVYNPGPWTLGSDGDVIHANGCGFVNDDLLVRSFGRVQRARGRSLEGDLVRKEQSSFGASMDPVVRVQVPVPTTSIICRYAGRFRQDLLSRLSHWPSGRREWLQSFILGADMRLDALTTSALRRLGLLHIVVLSGSHLAVLSMFSLIALRFLPLILLNIGVLTMRTWPTVWTMTALMSLAGLVVFSFIVGLPQSVQRAMILCLALQLSDLFWIRKSAAEVLVGVWLLQTTLFPVHILSLSMFLSWSGSLILSGFLTSSFRKSWFALIQERIFIQTIFAIGSFLIFGSIGIASIFANIVFAPLFSLALPADIFVLFAKPSSVLAHILVESQMALLKLVRKLDDWQFDHPWLMYTLDTKFQNIHLMMRIAQTGFFLILLIRVYNRTEKRNDSN